MGFVRVLVGLALLVVPVLVIIELPQLLDAAGSISATGSAPIAAPTAFRLSAPTPTARARFSPINDAPPPTLAPPAVTATAVPTPRPTPSGERVVIGNTDGRGAVLRSDPVSGRQVAALREQQVLAVIERRAIPGSGDWLHVQTADGTEGWVSGLVARPLATPTPPPNR